MNSEPAKVEICFHFILFWAKQKIKPCRTTQRSQQSYGGLFEQSNFVSD